MPIQEREALRVRCVGCFLTARSAANSGGGDRRESDTRSHRRIQELDRASARTCGVTRGLAGAGARARGCGEGIADGAVQPLADENIHPSLACLTPESFEHVEEAVHFLELVAAIPPGLVADPTAQGKRKDVLRNAIAELKSAGFLRAEDISPLIDDCYGDDDTSAAKLKRLREYLRSC